MFEHFITMVNNMFNNNDDNYHKQLKAIIDEADGIDKEIITKNTYETMFNDVQKGMVLCDMDKAKMEKYYSKYYNDKLPNGIATVYVVPECLIEHDNLDDIKIDKTKYICWSCGLRHGELLS